MAREESAAQGLRVPPRALLGRARQGAGGLAADPESRGGPGSAGLCRAVPGNPGVGCERVLLEAPQPCGQTKLRVWPAPGIAQGLLGPMCFWRCR